jgi:hypothetical protein
MTHFLDVLKRKLLREGKWREHGERLNGTQKISTLLNGRGDAVALDLSSGSENAIWALARLVPDTLMPEVRREPYTGQRGRNSNVNVHQLKGKPLVRLYPDGLEQAERLMDHLAAR